MSPTPFKKVLAANRGEIAIRIFRACTELGIKTVAIYSHEDLLSIHRYKADEAFLIGTTGDPIGAYLDMDTIIELALAQGVDAIHPGYGFLSENEAFARKCAEAGITFIGPTPDTLAALSDKTKARELAIRVGVPVIPGTDEPLKDADGVRSFCQEHGYPVILKAAFGGGGRGMRVIRSAADIEDAFLRASGEAKAAFGRGEVFCERYVENAKHIEIQILADSHGNRVHLFERDCSVQRRYQKVIEFAPAITVSDTAKNALYEYALSIAAGCDYQNAGTVEFLVDAEERCYFIEVNPRIQVEHTVTEVLTGRDLVQSQIRVAEGYALDDPQLNMPNQSSIKQNGCAIQCRITTEDPSTNFLPDTGKIITYRAAAGFGIRLDAGTGGAGTVITGDYDSMIVKMTAGAITFEDAARKALRSLREFRIRGVKTNIPFLEKAVTHPTFLSGAATTRFIDETPDLLQVPRRRDRATRLLRALANSVVNGALGTEQRFERPLQFVAPKAPHVKKPTPKTSPAMAAFRQGGAEGLSQWLRAHEAVQITDTTFRDAHQSLLATRVRTTDLLTVAPATAELAENLFSVEMWGGATFDVSYRFLREDPWARLRRLRAAMPNVLLQMLLRGANGVGYTNYPDNVIRRFIQASAKNGIDIFRIFDALNWVPNMELAIEEVAKSGKIAEACLCYTGDVSDPNEDKYDLHYYVTLAKTLEARGAHIIAIKDMAGLLKPRAARMLVSALRQEVGLPIHLHTHDTSGNGIAMLLAATEAGVDAVDCALSSVSGLTSQPSLNAFAAALGGDSRSPQIDADKMQQLAQYWESIREMYYPFESGLKASTAEVYEHEIPGGQYTNLKPRAIQLGLGEKWGDIKRQYRAVSDACGRLIKVTPSSKVVADFAMFLVQNELTIDDCTAGRHSLDYPQSVVDFMAGRLGQPYGGFPTDLQRAILGDQAPLTTRVGASLPDHDFESTKKSLYSVMPIEPSEEALLSHALYPKVFEDYWDYRLQYGEISNLPTPAVLYGLEVGETILAEIEPGKTLVVTLKAVGGLTEDGQRQVYFELNGQPREVSVADLIAQAHVETRRKATPSNPHEIGATMPGKVVSVEATVGSTVQAGDTLLVVEAMKMETSVSATTAGTIGEVLVTPGDKVNAKDLLVVIV